MTIEFVGLIGLFQYALWDMRRAGVDGRLSWCRYLTYCALAVVVAVVMVLGTNYLIGVLR